MGNKTLEYKQITVRIPPEIWKAIIDYTKIYGVTIQDAMLLIFKEWFDEFTSEG